MPARIRIPGTSFDQVAQWVLQGMEQERQAILARIAEIRAKLGEPQVSTPRHRTHRAHRTHQISPEGRAAIAAGQRKRWTAARREAEKRAKKAGPPRWVGRGQASKPRKKPASPLPPPPVESPDVQ